MGKRIIFDKPLLVSDASVTNIAYTWNDVIGVKPPTGTTPMSAEAHMFVLNDVEYQPNYFLDGDTKFKCAYRVDGVDAIMLEYIKSTGLANIKIRRDKNLAVNDESNQLLFYEKTSTPPQYVVINLNGAVAHVKYDEGVGFSLDSISGDGYHD